MIASGTFSPDDPNRYRPLVRSLTEGGDPFLVVADFASYIRTQDAASALFRDRELWLRKSIANTANVGWFSSDRTVMEYATEIWKVAPVNGAKAPEE
jgi:starch phosphorylase